MKTLHLNLKERSYPIHIGKGIVKNTAKLITNAKLPRNTLLITNKTIYQLYKPLIQKVFLQNKQIKVKVLILPDTEKIKSLKYLKKIAETAIKTGKNKQLLFIGLGGGVIGDLVGFCASVFKRGVPYIQIPTSLLAQVDSSVGGKTAIDLDIAKNMIGTFYQPKMVIIDPNFIDTLSKSQIKEGLSEILKYGLIKDKQIFTILDKNNLKNIIKNKSTLETLIYKSLSIKKNIVEIDEKETKGIRTILNFGHTLAHAIEAVSNFSISHGRAVAQGILIATEISLELDLLKNERILDKIKAILNKLELIDPMTYKLDPKDISQTIIYDKKFQDNIRMVLIKDIAQVVVKDNLDYKIIKKVIKNFFSQNQKKFIDNVFNK